jgi:hypothetical protein
MATSTSSQYAGTCSKTLRALPSLSTFLRTVRTSLAKLTSQTASTSAAVQNLLHSQADFGNQAAAIHYGMRAASSQLDGMQLELRTSDDALLASQSADDLDAANNAPGIPDSLTFLPSTTLGATMLYFVKPDYAGGSPIVGYEYATYASVDDAWNFAAAGSAVTYVSEDDLSAAIQQAPWNTPNADSMFTLYGTDLRVLTNLPDGVCLRIRAKNLGGARGTALYSDWSAPTAVCKAASSPDEFKPVVEHITTGCQASLVEWKLPAVRQPDGSWASVGGIHSYSINGTVVHGGDVCVASVQLAPAGSVAVTVAASAAAFGTPVIGTSDPVTALIPNRLPTPTIVDFRIVTEPGEQSHALITCKAAGQYSGVPLRFTVDYADLTANTTASDFGEAATSNGTVFDAVLRVPSIGSLFPMHRFTFRLRTTSFITGYDSAYTSTLGPYLAPWSALSQLVNEAPGASGRLYFDATGKRMLVQASGHLYDRTAGYKFSTTTPSHSFALSNPAYTFGNSFMSADGNMVVVFSGDTARAKGYALNVDFWAWNSSAHTWGLVVTDTFGRANGPRRTTGMASFSPNGRYAIYSDGNFPCLFRYDPQQTPTFSLDALNDPPGSYAFLDKWALSNTCALVVVQLYNAVDASFTTDVRTWLLSSFNSATGAFDTQRTILAPVDNLSVVRLQMSADGTAAIAIGQFELGSAYVPYVFTGAGGDLVANAPVQSTVDTSGEDALTWGGKDIALTNLAPSVDGSHTQTMAVAATDRIIRYERSSTDPTGAFTKNGYMVNVQQTYNPTLPSDTNTIMGYWSNGQPPNVVYLAGFEKEA